MNYPSLVAHLPLKNAEKADIPGLHIVANFEVQENTKLLTHHSFKKFIEEQIDVCGLTKVGEVYHDFPGGGFTAVICLTESHLSIHTWPERNYITFDIFLSSFLKDNSSVTRSIYEAVVSFFNATITLEKIIER